MRVPAWVVTVFQLGGKSPVVIDPKCDLKTAAKRIMWGKCVNVGQTCVAPDYILVQEDAEDTIVQALKEAFVFSQCFLRVADSILSSIGTTSSIRMAPLGHPTSVTSSTSRTLTVSRAYWTRRLEQSCLVVKPTSPSYLSHRLLLKVSRATTR